MGASFPGESHLYIAEHTIQAKGVMIATIKENTVLCRQQTPGMPPSEPFVMCGPDGKPLQVEDQRIVLYSDKSGMRWWHLFATIRGESSISEWISGDECVSFRPATPEAYRHRG